MTNYIKVKLEYEIPVADNVLVGLQLQSSQTVEKFVAQQLFGCTNFPVGTGRLRTCSIADDIDREWQPR